MSKFATDVFWYFDKEFSLSDRKLYFLQFIPHSYLKTKNYDEMDYIWRLVYPDGSKIDGRLEIIDALRKSGDLKPDQEFEKYGEFMTYRIVHLETHDVYGWQIRTDLFNLVLCFQAFMENTDETTALKVITYCQNKALFKHLFKEPDEYVIDQEKKSHTLYDENLFKIEEYMDDNYVGTSDMESCSPPESEND